MLWFFSGNERMRWPVALKNALSTAGAATQMVGSPTPPQGSLPPVPMTIDSTFATHPHSANVPSILEMTPHVPHSFLLLRALCRTGPAASDRLSLCRHSLGQRCAERTG